MSGAADLYNALSRTDKPQQFVAGLSKADLIRLHRYVETLLKSGWPAVVRSTVTTECAARFVKQGGGQ